MAARAPRFRWIASARAASVAVLAAAGAPLAADFVNFESPHVHPLDLVPGGALVLAVDTADARLEIFAPTANGLARRGSVAVGLEPVSVRARSATEAWVVNRVSDSVSIVDLATRNVRKTLAVCDEPGDVVFAGTPERAFVSCGSTDRLLLFDAAAPGAPLAEVPILGETPRALAVSADRQTVFAAILESGNGTTILSGGRDKIHLFPPLSAPPNVVSYGQGPYGGRNPPPNDGIRFKPEIRPEYLAAGTDPAPAVGLIVRKDAGGAWRDDNVGDWTPFVSGNQAERSGRPVGWDLPDRDVALVDAASLDVRYARALMTTCTALGIRPSDGEVTLVGTDATNQIRYEANVKARFVRVRMARFAPATPETAQIVDLNAGHLSYSDAQIAQQANPATASQPLRDASLGDPRAIVWNAAGNRGYVAGLGSNNLVVIGPTGNRLSPLGAPGAPAVALGAGPTGLALDAARGRLYVLERFAARVTTIDLTSELPVASTPFHDATPASIRAGRRFLYDTHATSGLGQAACASCHVDGRLDRLAWDLGDPAGAVKPLDPGFHNLGMGFVEMSIFPFQDFHPMKGPMVTQTLFDIIGKEPLHWRGDRDGLEEFNGAFRSLLGDDRLLTSVEMQQFEDFLATLTFPPNPYRDLDNSLAPVVPLPAHRATGRFALPAGAPLPPGDPTRGLELYRPPHRQLQNLFACSSCHTLPTGTSAAVTRVGDAWAPLAPGPNGEQRLGLVAIDSRTNRTLKVPQLRTVTDKVGMETTVTESLAGFGFTSDGSIDSLARFFNSFALASDQDVADLIAFVLSMPGSELPPADPDASPLEPPGPASRDTHAAVGRQITFDAGNREDPELLALLAQLETLADAGKVGLAARGRSAGLERGWSYLGGGLLQSDRAAETTSVQTLRASAAAGAEVTFTALPTGTELRLGIDRDGDGAYDRDELDACGDPADPAVLPLAGCLFRNGFEAGDAGAWSEAATG